MSRKQIWRMAVDLAMTVIYIENGTTEGITSYLQEIVDQEDGLPEDLEKAKELLAKLAEYKPLAKVEEREGRIIT